MPKRPRPKRRRLSFTVARVFPPDNPLAVDLLRLMTAHDDLNFLNQFMTGQPRPRRPAALSVAASRWFFLQRLFAALMVETLKLLSDMERLPEFRALARHFDEDTQRALAELHSVPQSQTNPVYRALYRARNKAAFHYDRGQYRTSLRTLLERHGADAKSHIIVVPVEGGAINYYTFADQLATEISFGLAGPGGPVLPHAEFFAAVDLQGALTRLVDGAFTAYLGMRGLSPRDFSEEADEDR